MKSGENGETSAEVLDQIQYICTCSDHSPLSIVAILPQKPQVQDKRLSITIGIYLRQGTAEGFGFPSPDDLPTFIADSRGGYPGGRGAGYTDQWFSGLHRVSGCAAAEWAGRVITVSIQNVTHQPIRQLGFEPSGLGRHDFTRIRYGHECFHGGGIE